MPLKHVQMLTPLKLQMSTALKGPESKASVWVRNRRHEAVSLLHVTTRQSQNEPKLFEQHTCMEGSPWP